MVVSEEASCCLVCTLEIKYYCIPEACSHNMICWTCMLKQRTKLDIKGCPACKEESERVLITDNPDDKVAKWGSSWIEDPEQGIIYARQDIRSEIQRKIGLHCLHCQRKAG